MPRSLDIYGLTRHRNTETIQRFFTDYIDRPESEDRGDEELMLKSLSASSESYESEPAISLTHIIKRGLQYPRRAFTVLLSARSKDIDRAILCFTEDDQLIVGLSIADEGMKPENQEKAKNLFLRLINRFNCHSGIIVVETPPPPNEDKMLAMLNDERTVFSIQLDQRTGAARKGRSSR